VFLVLSVALAVIAFRRFPWVSGPQDLLLAILVTFGVFLLPMLFVFGGWYLRARIPVDSVNGRKRRWRALLIYSTGVLLLCVANGVWKPFKMGSSIGWLITLSTMLGYSYYLLLPLSALAVFVCLLALVPDRL
jgi:hypothetical protein